MFRVDIIQLYMYNRIIINNINSNPNIINISFKNRYKRKISIISNWNRLETMHRFYYNERINTKRLFLCT